MYNKGTSKIKDIRIEDMFWSMTGYTEGKLQIKHIYIYSFSITWHTEEDNFNRKLPVYHKGLQAY